MASVKQTLKQYAKQNQIPMHMPGHKRNPKAAPYLNDLSEQLDFTEIDGLDNLHAPDGILKQAMERAAKLWHSERSYFLVNGSTCGILAGIRALTHRNDQVLVMRNSHKSVFHAIEICGLRPVFLQPPVINEVQIFGSLKPSQVKEALKKHPNIRLIIVVSPTYEGVISDLKEICRIAHDKEIPVLVDEAHGAHLNLHPNFPGGAVLAGADLIVQSLHKTLPSLTQTAILHTQGPRIDQKRLKHQLSVFETSSPSYLLMASIDGCIRGIEQKKFNNWSDCLTLFKKETALLKHLKIIEKTEEMFLHDSGKIIISTVGTNLNGETLKAKLQENGIQPEMSAPSYVLAMTGLGDTKETLHALASALIKIDSECSFGSSGSNVILPPCPKMLMPPEKALEQDFEFVSPDKAVGKISAEYVWAYPPGIPLLLPGEKISEFPSAKECALYSSRGRLPESIAVVKG